MLPPSETDDAAGAAPGPAWGALARAAWDGARLGNWLISHVALPVAIVAAVAGLVPTAIGLGAGHGVSVHWLLPAGLTLAGTVEGCGFLAGGFVAGAAALAFRGRAAGLGARWWARLNRPIGRREVGAESGGDFVPDLLPPPRRRAWWRRWERWLAVPAILALAGSVGFGAYARRVVDRRLGAAVAAADGVDPGWRWEDLMAAREFIPDDENSADTVAQVVDLMPEGWMSPAPTPPGQAAPPPPALKLAFDRAQEAPRNVRLDDATAATLRAELGGHPEAVALARTLAEGHVGYHELELRDNPYETPLPLTQASRDVARLLAADTALRAHDGRIDETLDSCRAILGVGRSIGDEPFLISGLVRVAIGVTALAATRRALGQGEASDAALARLQALVLDEWADPLLVRGMRGERASLDVLIRRIRTGVLPIAQLGGKREGEGEAGEYAVASWGRLMFDHQRAVALEWSNVMVAIAARPARERPPLWRAWEAEIVRTKNTPFMGYTAALPVFMMPATQVASTSDARYRAELGCSVILLAAERHRLKHGAWPASLAALDPEFLADPPPDPYTGGPLVVEHCDGQFLVHTVGPNLRDEHGAYEPKLWGKGGPDDAGTGAWDVPLRGQPPEEPE